MDTEFVNLETNSDLSLLTGLWCCARAKSGRPFRTEGDMRQRSWTEAFRRGMMQYV